MSNAAKWLRITVTDINTGKAKANVRVPASLANFGMRMAAKYAPDSIGDLDMTELMSMVENGGDGKLVEVDDEEKGEHVEVYVE